MVCPDPQDPQLAPQDPQLAPLPLQKSWDEFDSLQEYREYMQDRLAQELARLPETTVDLDQVMQVAYPPPEKCGHCKSTVDVDIRSFHWYLRPRGKDLNKPEHTYLTEPFCQQCYDCLVDLDIGSKSNPLIGWDYWDAVDGLYATLHEMDELYGPYVVGPTA